MSKKLNNGNMKMPKKRSIISIIWRLSIVGLFVYQLVMFQRSTEIKDLIKHGIEALIWCVSIVGILVMDTREFLEKEDKDGAESDS